MNILIATGIYPPESGGPATYSYEVAAALCRQGYRVTVITYGDGGSSKKEVEKNEEFDVAQRGVLVIKVPRHGGVLVRYLRYFLAVYEYGKQAELIYAQGAVSEGVPATLAAKVLGKPLLMRIPGDYAWEVGMQRATQSVEPSLDRFLTRAHSGLIGVYERLERWTARQARAVIVPSLYLRSVVERWGIPSERLNVIKNAVQPLSATEDRSRLREQEDLNGKIVCLTAARAVPWKGVKELIMWWHRLPATHVLLVAGDGPELEHWKQQAKTEGVADRVRFLGRVPRAQMARWYDVADVFVLHTGYEGYPHTVPEAIGRGLPCLVSDQGGNPETREEFGDQVTVLPYQDRDRWVSALQAVSIRTLVREVAPVWTHEKMVAQTEQSLREVIQPSEGVTRVIMLGYERELVKTESATFQRVAGLANEKTRVSALVISRLPEDVVIERDGLRVYAQSGSWLRRIVRTIRVGIQEARRLPGRTVVSGQDPFAAGMIAYLISRLTNHPLELQEHGDFWSGTWVKERWEHRFWGWVGIRLLRRAERVRVVSERVKEHLMVQGVATNKIAIIPVAQELERFLAQPLTEFKHAEQVIRVPGRFVEQKRLDILLRAFAIVHEKYLNTRLELVGVGPLESELRQQVERYGLSQVVSIRPWASPESLWEGADLFVLSSAYEGFGRTITEAMAAGVPVISTEVGCAGSVLRPEIDGLVVPVGDVSALAQAMIRLLEDDEARERMRVSARERVRALPSVSVLHEAQRGHWLGAVRGQVTGAPGPRFEVWVFAFVVFTIVTRALSVGLFHGQLLSREWGFFTLVQHWFQGYGYSFASELGCSSAYRSPGYLFFLTAVYTFFDPSNTWAQAIIQNIFVVGALWLTYVVGKRLVGPRAGLLGAFIMACYPYTFYHYTQFYHTFLQSFFLLLVVWSVLRLVDTRRYAYAVGSGFAIGALAYVQGTILPVTPLIALWVFWQLWSDKKRALISVALMAVCSAGFIAPWTYRNWKTFHQIVPLTTDLGHALFKANNENIYEITQRGYPQEIIDDIASSTTPLYKQYRLPAYLEEDLKRAGVFQESILWTEWHPREPNGNVTSCAALGPLNEFEFNQYWLGKTKEQWHSHWGWEVWRLPLQKIRTFWSPGLFPFIKTGAPWSFAGSAWKEWLARASVWVSTAVVIWAGWLGLGLALKRRKPEVWLVLSILLIFTLLHSLIAGYTKYRIPLDHLLAIYAAFCLLTILDWIRGKRL